MGALTAFREIAIPYGLPVARVLLAAVFLYSGFDKLWRWQAGIKEVTDLGLPWPTLCAAMTIAVQLIGSLTVVSGVGAALGAALLAAFTIAATILGHPFWLLRGETARREFTTSLEHLAIIGGLILVVLNDLPES
jgi:putative oxidoreductase